MLLRQAAPFFLAALVGCNDPASLDDGAGGSGEGAGRADATGSGAGSDGGGDPGEGGSVPAVEDPFEPPPDPTPLTDDQLADLKDDIDNALAGASASYSALIVGLDTGQVVYEKNPNTLKKPASNTKLFTTAAALALQGESGRPAAGLYAAAVQGGVVQGDLVLLAEHDPSATPWFGDTSRQALDAAAEALAASGVTGVTGAAVAKGEFLYEGNSLGTIDFPSERSQTATAFRAALVAAGIDVAGGASTQTGFDPPEGSMLVGAVPSASIDVISHAINVPSHNEMADLLLHHIGVLGGGASTYADGFVTIQSTLDDLGVAHEGLDLNDGSGLSHDNRVSARHIVDLFQAMESRPEWSAYVHSMAISGIRGTIASRMTGENTWGRFWGKTGTLTGVIALSGVLFHRHDGQRYVASFLANDVGNSTSARAALDSAVAALGANRKGATGLPDTPALLRVSDDENGETAVVELGEVEGATGYLIWRSADGRTWRREDARLVTHTTHRTFAFDGQLFVRVTAVNEVGESAPSAVLGARLSEGGSRALFVDGNDRYAGAPVPENPLGWGSDAVVAHAAAISGPFESASHVLVEEGDVELGGYSSVLWALGRESSDDETFTIAEQQKVRAFVEGGGRFFVSGAELGYDLVDQGTAEDASFARDVLGIDYAADDAGTTFIMAADVDVAVPLARFSKLGRHEIAFPDVLTPASGGLVCLDYVAGGGGAACVLTDTSSGGRVIALGFPLEALDDPAAAAALVGLLGS